jgi:cation:H+ antiporter
MRRDTQPLHKPDPVAALSLLGLCLALTLPALAFRIGGFHPEAHPLLGLLVFGLGIVSAAFALTWAAEVAELEIGSGLAIVFLALVTVLPEYAVDLTFAWKAAGDETWKPLALANMCGANRLLIGLGWPVVALIAWYRFGRKETVLDRRRSGDVVWLFVATLYSLQVPVKGYLAWYDAIVFVAIYALYVRGSRGAGDDSGEHELVGPPVVMAEWPRRRRRAAYVGLFAWAAAVIFASAEPFSEALVHGGVALGIDRVFMVQWLAPLASEAPEFVVVVLLTMRGRGDLGLGAFVSSKINQWTLLVGGVPLAYGLARASGGHGFAPSMGIDDRQVEELVLTATQGLYATATIADLRFTLRQALAILGLFLLQFLGSIVLEATGRHGAIAPFHYGCSALYVLLAARVFLAERSHVLERVRDAFRGAHGEAVAGPPERGGHGSPDESDA